MSKPFQNRMASTKNKMLEHPVDSFSLNDCSKPSKKLFDDMLKLIETKVVKNEDFYFHNKYRIKDIDDDKPFFKFEQKDGQKNNYDLKLKDVVKKQRFVNYFRPNSTITCPKFDSKLASKQLKNIKKKQNYSRNDDFKIKERLCKTGKNKTIEENEEKIIKKSNLNVKFVNMKKNDNFQQDVGLRRRKISDTQSNQTQLVAEYPYKMSGFYKLDKRSLKDNIKFSNVFIFENDNFERIQSFATIPFLQQDSNQEVFENCISDSFIHDDFDYLSQTFYSKYLDVNYNLNIDSKIDKCELLDNEKFPENSDKTYHDQELDEFLRFEYYSTLSNEKIIQKDAKKVCFLTLNY
jgi:hypothetical protein